MVGETGTEVDWRAVPAKKAKKVQGFGSFQANEATSRRRFGTTGTEIIEVQRVGGGRGDDDVFYLLLQKQKIGASSIYLQEGTYHKRLFSGPSTIDMKK